MPPIPQKKKKKKKEEEEGRVNEDTGKTQKECHHGPVPLGLGLSAVIGTADTVVIKSSVASKVPTLLRVGYRQFFRKCVLYFVRVNLSIYLSQGNKTRT